MYRYILASDIDSDAFIAALLRDDPRLAIITRGASRIRVYIQSDAFRIRYLRSSDWMHDQKIVDALADEFPGATLTTPAAFGMWLLRKKFHVGDIFMRMDSRGDFRARFTRASLYGGRCEVYQPGSHPGTWAYDINSSYSYAAYRLQFPHPNLTYKRQTRQADALRDILTLPGASQCVVSQSGMRPYLPFRVRNYAGEIRTLYPELHLCRGIWTHNELRAALERGVQIVCVEKSYLTHEVENPFREFIEYCYGRRAEHKIWKLILNATWGRFAIVPSEDSGLGIWRPASAGDAEAWAELPADKRHVACGIGWIGIIRRDIEAYPLWNAMIQADARQRLYDLAGRCDAIYVDTDCVFTRDCTVFDSQISSELGGLKARYLRSFHARGAKLYIADREAHAKGVSGATAADVLGAPITHERDGGGGGLTWPHYRCGVDSEWPDL